VNTKSTINKQKNVASTADDARDAEFTPQPMNAENTVSPDAKKPESGSDDRSEGQISYTSELIRKSIHLASLTIPIIYYYVHRETALFFLFPMVLISIGIDVGRFYIPAIHHMVERMFDKILRPHERRAGLLSGATYVLISALLCVAIFPKLITVTAFSILIVSDSSSAIFGRAYGKHRFLDKSLEGTLAFIVSAWLVVLITPKAGWVPIEYVIGAFAAIVGGVAEAASVSLHVDDNFSIPVSVGFTMWGLYWLMSVLDPSSYGALYQKLLGIT
jgi:dolichol kinase